MPPVFIVTTLQDELKLSVNIGVIKDNREKIRKVRAELDENLKIVAALEAANQSLCPHKNKVTYSDPRDWGWNCPDCGGSK